jgi:hypothetical protein
MYTDGKRTCAKVGGCAKVWENVRKGEKSLEDVRDGRELVRRFEGVRRFGKMLEKLCRV